MDDRNYRRDAIVKMPTDNHQESVQYIRSKIRSRPRIAVILGSGLGNFAKLLKRTTVLPTSDIPFYPVSTTPGHAGKLVFGKLLYKKRHVNLLVFQGRIHFYEVNDLEKVIYPVLIAHQLGVKKLIITNAAGGINSLFLPGDLMLITDHINFMFTNPLIGFRNLNNLRNHFPYDEILLTRALKVASNLRISIKTGTYCAVKGPTYETAAEIEMLRRLGGDAVGMSTVPEVIVANSLGMKVLGISVITNLATGISQSKLTHHEVTAVARRVQNNFGKLLQHIMLNPDVSG